MKPVFKNKVNNCIKKPFLSTEFFNKEKSKTISETHSTLCSRNLVPFYIVIYYMNWVKISWAHNMSSYLLT